MKSFSKRDWCVGALVTVLLVFFGTARLLNAQTAPMLLSGYAWGAANSGNGDGSGYGFVFFQGEGYGVNVSGDALVGAAWSPLLGWIDFGGLSGFPETGPTYCGTGNCNAHIEGDNVYGWARLRTHKGNDSDWDGWISLRGAGYGVKKVNGADGQFALEGYAWGSSASDSYVGGYGPGWLYFPENALDVPAGGGCGGVCAGGSPTYFCTATKTDNQDGSYRVLWEVTSSWGDSEGVEYAFSDGGVNESSENPFEVVYPADTESASMEVTVSDVAKDIEHFVTCNPVNFNPDIGTVADITLALKKDADSTALSEITVSVGDTYVVEAEVSPFGAEQCTLNGVVLLDASYSETYTGTASTEYTLSCVDEGGIINDGSETSETVRVRVVNDGEFDEF